MWNFFKSIISFSHIFSNYLPEAKWLLSENPPNEVRRIIQQYLLSLKWIIILFNLETIPCIKKTLLHLFLLLVSR